MGLVRIDTQPWGIVWEAEPDRELKTPEASVSGVLSTYTSFDGAGNPIPLAPAPIFADPEGTTPLGDPFVTDLYGGFPGYVEAGRYCLEVAGGDPLMVEATQGDGAGGGADADDKGFVEHGAVAGTARPAGFASIEWIGSVEPTNAIDGDTWIDTT